MKNKKVILELKRKLYALALASSISTTLSGCSTEIATNNNVEYSTLDQMNENDIKNGISQTIKVPNNDFNLVVSYKFNLSENQRWTICDNKELIMEISTQKLNNKTKVYIDNIHTDTSICSVISYYDSILQDTMDDKIHNSLMLGFPISNDLSYIGINEIEGQNETFIRGYSYGYNGYNSGSIEEKRRTESNYLENGVYANEINSVIDLIIIDENNNTNCVSVPSKIKINVWPFVKFEDINGTYYNYYFSVGNTVYKQKLTEEEYQEYINGNKPKTLEK